jgi:hypothetical protein
VPRWFERQRHLVDFTLSSLWRRKGKNLSLWLVYTLVVFLIASVMFCAQSLRKEASVLLEAAPDIVVQRNMGGRHELIPIGYGDRLKGIRGVLDVRPRLWGYYYDQQVRANYTFQAGNDPGAPPLPDGSASVGEGILRVRGIAPGAFLAFRTAAGRTIDLKLARGIPSESALVSADLILVSEKDFRTIFGIPPGFATDIALSVGNPKELATIARKIPDILPDARPILREEIGRTYKAVFGWRSGILLVILSGTALSFFILAWDKASGLSAEEKREIGILKAVGWETTDVILLKLWEGTVVSFSAFLAGTILAYIHVFLADSPLIIPVLKGWSTLYPTFHLVPHPDAAEITELFFLTVAPYTVATIVPSWRAATIDPDSVMRGGV